MVGKVISHYKILEKLGQGGMGEVYLAQDIKLGRKVALKFLPSEYTSQLELKTRFMREAQAAAALNHPNIITVHEVAEYESRPFIAMEYVEGESLKDLLARKELSIGEVLDIALQISDGLAVAHLAGIIHRDIKPQNILMGKDARVRICDFGLAKAKRDVTLTQVGSTLGTVAYMSPEQAQGIEADQRSDIFSLGVVLYEMITGHLPFTGDHEAAVIYSIINETPEPLARYKANVPEELQKILGKALEKDRETRYQTNNDMSADLKRLKRMTEGAVPSRECGVSVPEPGKRSIAIMYFEDVTKDDDIKWLSRGLPHMLITDLEQSKFIEVVGYQRLFDILRLLGKEDEERISARTATEVAKRAGATAMVVGSIFRSGNRIRIDYELQDVKYGKLICADKVVGEEPLALADELANQIKLTLHIDPDKDPSKKVADVTTHSPEAYRHYLEGEDWFYKIYLTEAEKSYKKALEFDSTFAMAYFRLAMMKWGERDREAKELMAKAVEYSDKVSQKERYYIKSLEARLSGDYTQAIKELHRITERYPDEKQAFFWLGVIHGVLLREPEEAVRSLTKVIEIDPLYKFAYNMLAYAYNDIGDFEKSIWATDKYISLAPDEANPYDTRADLYAFNGKLDQAIESYKKALEIKADFVGGLDKLGHMYLFKREYAKAKSCYQQLSSSTQDKFRRSGGRTYLALIPLYQGKFEKALEVLDDGIAADRMEQTQGWGSANKHFLKACVCKEKKELKLALREAEEGIGIWQKAYLDDTTEGQFYCVRFLGEENELAQADELAKALTLSEHNLVASLRNFRRAAQVTTYFCVHYLLARTHLDSGRLGDAVTEFERLLSYYGYDRLFWAIWDVKTRYYLGMAYEKSGWNRKAIEQYEEFLEIWKDADPGIPEVEDAKERLAQLKSET